MGLNFFIFMQFLGTIGQNNRLMTPPLWLASLLWEILDPQLLTSFELITFPDIEVYAIKS